MNLKEQIINYRKLNPKAGFKQIAKQLNCALSTVSYHIGKGQKLKTKTRAYRYRELNPLCAKLSHFKELREHKMNFDKTLNKRRSKAKSLFTTSDLLTKIGEKPICYLTGDSIDLDKPETYQLDHITPVCKGGDNSLANLGLTTKQANLSKDALTVEEYIALCKKVLIHHGYNIGVANGI